MQQSPWLNAQRLSREKPRRPLHHKYGIRGGAERGVKSFAAGVASAAVISRMTVGKKVLNVL